MISLTRLRTHMRLAAAIAVALSALAASVIAATDVAHGEAAQQPSGFGAAARVAVGQAAAKLAPHSHLSSAAPGR